MSDELLRRLSDLWNVDTTERDKAIKLLSKIFSKILSKPSEQKYGDLNFAKIRQKFEHCRPGFYLLYDAGFKQSTNGLRLQWIYNDENYQLLKKVNDLLQQKCNDPNSLKPKETKDKKSEESAENKHRRQIQQRLKKKNSEKENKRKLIKEKIAMQKKEQKLEQKHLLNKIKESKERQKREAAAFMKQQFTMTMEAMMNDIMAQMVQQQNGDNECKEEVEMPSNYRASYSTGVYGSYLLKDKNKMRVIEKLFSLGIGTREQLKQASDIAQDPEDECSVVEAFERMKDEES